MRNLVRLCTILTLCFLPLLSAYASSIPLGTYTLTGVSLGGSSLNGTITLGANGLATAANLTYANATYGSPTFSNVVSAGATGSNPSADYAYISGSNGQVTLYYFDSLNTSGGINLCLSGSGCTGSSSLQIYYPGYQANFTGGSLTVGTPSIAVTPEPSNWLLLTTGLMVIAGVLYLRRLQAPETAAEKD